MEDVNDGHLEINVDSDELLAETVRKYPVLYNKSLKEFKDRTMNNNAWKQVAECLQNVGIKSGRGDMHDYLFEISCFICSLI